MLIALDSSARVGLRRGAQADRLPQGQSPQQQGQDDAQCAAWAKQSTGIDPAVVAANPPHNRRARRSVAANACGVPPGRRGGGRGDHGDAGEAQEWGRWWALWRAGGEPANSGASRVQAQQQELIQTWPRQRRLHGRPRLHHGAGGSMTRFLPLVAALAWLAAGTASAGDFDGSKLLICAPVEAIDCAPGEDCKGRPDDIGAPSPCASISRTAIVGPKRTTRSCSWTRATSSSCKGRNSGMAGRWRLTRKRHHDRDTGEPRGYSSCLGRARRCEDQRDGAAQETCGEQSTRPQSGRHRLHGGIRESSIRIWTSWLLAEWHEVYGSVPSS